MRKSRPSERRILSSSSTSNIFGLICMLYSFGSSGSMRLCGLLNDICNGLSLTRQHNHKARTTPRLRGHAYASAMLLDDLPGNRQAQARTLAHRLGGEEGIKNLFQGFRRHAFSRVLHGGINRGLVGPGLDGDLAGAVYGLRGIGHEIEQDLIELRRGTGNTRNLAQLAYHFDTCFERVLGNQQGIVDAIIERHIISMRLIETTEVLEAQHQLADLGKTETGITKQGFHTAKQQAP